MKRYRHKISGLEYEKTDIGCYTVFFDKADFSGVIVFNPNDPDWEEIAPPDLVTEDGVELNQFNENGCAQLVFSVYTKDEWTTKQCTVNQAKSFFNWKHFSTSEARAEYIALNKPRFSLKDIEESYTSPKDSPLYLGMIAKLKEIRG